LQWSEVLSLTHDNAFGGRFASHRAYALYRSDKFDAARECLESAPKEVRDAEGALHLKAQILYRSGHYSESADCYDRLLAMLLEEAGGDESAVDPAALDDLRLNLAASYVASGRAEALLKHPQFAKLFEYLIAAGGSVIGAGVAGGKGASKAPSAITNAVFELLYNAACALIDSGHPSAAMRALVHAYNKGKADLMADAEPNDAEALAQCEDDLTIVRAQAAYLLQSGHYYGAAQAIYQDILRSKPSDTSIPAVIAINNSLLATFSGSGRELLDALRRLKATITNASTTAKLLQRHLLALHHNSAVISALLGQGDDANTSSEKASLALQALQKHSISGGDPHAAALASSLQLLKDGIMPALKGSSETAGAGAGAAKLHEALTTFLASSSASTGAGSGSAAIHPAVAMKAQALVSAGKLEEAAALLSSSSSAGLLHPAVAASCAHLVVSKGDVDRADKLLQSAADAWSKQASNKDNAAVLTHARGALLLHANKLEDAATLFEGLARSTTVSNEQKASALACLSVVRTKQAAALAATAASAGGSTEEIESQRSKLLASADICLREATAMVVGAGGKKPSFADLSSVNEREVDSLEEITADPLSLRGASATAASSSAAAAADSADSEAALARKAAKAASKKKKRLARRAKKREAYIAALKLKSPEFLALGVLPKPDPERWLPKNQRTYGKKGRKRQLAKASAANVSSGGAQGALGKDVHAEQAMRELDAKAKADAAKASGASAAGAGAAGAPGSAKKGAKGKSGKR
jgi:hypothetical protein